MSLSVSIGFYRFFINPIAYRENAPPKHGARAHAPLDVLRFRSTMERAYRSQVFGVQGCRQQKSYSCA